MNPSILWNVSLSKASMGSLAVAFRQLSSCPGLEHSHLGSMQLLLPPARISYKGPARPRDQKHFPSLKHPKAAMM